MKKYAVEMNKEYDEIFDNYIGDFIEAEDELEAIEFAKEWLLENGMTSEEVENLIFQTKEV